MIDPYSQPPPIPGAQPPPIPGVETPRGRYVHGPSGRLVDPSASQSDRNYAMVLHLTPVLALPTAGLTFLILPLVLWLIRKDDSPFINDHGKETVNFQISLLIYFLVSGALFVVLIGIPLMVLVSIFAIVASILASIAAHRGEFYRYPACIRLIP